MPKRLINLRRIKVEKINRGRSWIYTEIAAGRFPKPLDLGTGGANLWDEEEVDRAISEYVAAAKERAAKDKRQGTVRVARALAAGARRREERKVVQGTNVDSLLVHPDGASGATAGREAPFLPRSRKTIRRVGVADA